jgi:hypothetical protein
MDFLERDNETSGPIESENYTGEGHQPLLHGIAQTPYLLAGD